MYTLVRELGVKTALIKETPYLAVALIIAEMFYKWGSFSLELVGFMVTWAVCSFIGNTFVQWFTKPDHAYGSSDGS